MLKRLEAEGLQPSPAADPAAWLRRVTRWTSPDCRHLRRNWMRSRKRQCSRTAKPLTSAAVDRLLASPRYGERMAMDWLDVARYADTHGFNNDSDAVHVALARLGDSKLQRQHAV